MEILIFALIASHNAHRQRKPVIAEPGEIQPFDLQALRNSTDSKPSGSPSRREAYVPQTACFLLVSSDRDLGKLKLAGTII